MKLARLDHYNVTTGKPDETVRFYCDVLGFTDIPGRRPDFGVPGAWLFVEDHPAVHLVFVDDDRTAPTGPIDHIAFVGRDYLGTRNDLDDQGVEYEAVEHRHIDLFQIFLRDPNGIRIEINIPGEREAVAAHRAATTA